MKIAKFIRNEKGLTLIEVLIVVSIIAVILAIIIPNYASSTRSAQKKLCETSAKMLSAQMELYRIDHGVTPTGTPKAIIDLLTAGGYITGEPACDIAGFAVKDGSIIWNGAPDTESEGG